MALNEVMATLMFASFMALVFTGFPVAWILGGLAVMFTAFAIIMDVDFGVPINVDWAYTSLTVDRIWYVMESWVLVALPMFIFMGFLLDRSPGALGHQHVFGIVAIFGVIGLLSTLVFRKITR